MRERTRQESRAARAAPCAGGNGAGWTSAALRCRDGRRAGGTAPRARRRPALRPVFARDGAPSPPSLPTAAGPRRARTASWRRPGAAPGRRSAGVDDDDDGGHAWACLRVARGDSRSLPFGRCSEKLSRSPIGRGRRSTWRPPQPADEIPAGRAQAAYRKSSPPPAQMPRGPAARLPAGGPAGSGGGALVDPARHAPACRLPRSMAEAGTGRDDAVLALALALALARDPGDGGGMDRVFS